MGAVVERPVSAREVRDARRGLSRVASDNGSPGRFGDRRIAEMQRLRLLSAAVGVVWELGYHDVSVARITERAKVSRRTFYEQFENREECLLAVLDSTIDQISGEIAAANPADGSWRERVRSGLWVILCFFDREPALARLCIVEAQRGERIVLERRQELVERLATIVDEGRGEDSRSGYSGALTGQGVVGAVLQVLHSRLLEAESAPLTELLGQLMGMIVLPYLGAAVARREQVRPAPTPVSAKTTDGHGEMVSMSEPLASLPMRLTYRTARVLEVLAEHPASSNRQVADLVDIYDQGQMSKLLARLRRLGLIENFASNAHDKGEPNQWVLTQTGRQLTRSIHANRGVSPSALEETSR
jgi:AcrR family transcriptional regulator